MAGLIVKLGEKYTNTTGTQKPSWAVKEAKTHKEYKNL